MKREAEKKPSRRKPAAPARKLFGRMSVKVSGGANLKGQSVNVGGDVVGRDKMVAGDDVVVVRKGGRLTNIDLPRGVQIAVGVAAVALVVIAISSVVPRDLIRNGKFENGLEGWETSGAVQIIATGEPDTSPVGKNAAQVPIGASLQQTVTVSAERPQLTVWYRSPSGGVARGTLHIYLNDDLQLIVERIAAEAPQWKVAVVPDLSQYAGRPVRLRLEYAAVTARAGGRLNLPALQRNDALWIDNVRFVNDAELATIVATAAPTPIPAATPTRVVPSGQLSLSYTVSSKACKDSTYYNIAFTISAQGGTPPYTFYRDIDRIGGPTRAGITYVLTYGEHSAAVGTFFVVDSAGQRAEEKFFVTALDCP